MFDDIRPVVLAGVVHAEHHLAAAGNGGQRLERLLGQRGDAEHHDPARQPGGAGLGRQRLGGLEETLVDHGAA